MTCPATVHPIQETRCRHFYVDQESTFESLHLKIDDVTSRITKTVEKEVKDLRDYVDLGLSRVTDRLEEMNKKISELERVQAVKEPFPPERSVVAFKVPYTAGEDIRAVAETMLHDTNDGLGLRQIPAVRANRTPMRQGRPGTPKIELRSLDDKKAMSQLRNTDKYRHVYIRGALSHAEHLIELNFKTILRELPHGDYYRVTGNGRVVRNDVAGEAGATGGADAEHMDQDNAAGDERRGEMARGGGRDRGGDRGRGRRQVGDTNQGLPR